jgi:hypothetical protein
MERVIQRYARMAAARLAANPAIAATYLKAAAYAAGQGSAKMANMQFGHAVHWMVAERVDANPILRFVLSKYNPSNGPDFVGRGLLGAMKFEITTVKGIAGHLRSYGDWLEIATYGRPPGFVVVP